MCDFVYLYRHENVSKEFVAILSEIVFIEMFSVPEKNW